MLKGLINAHHLVRKAGAAPGATLEIHRTARGVCGPYQRMLAPLAFLSPQIQQAIADGRQPVSMKLDQLLTTDIPLAWADQKSSLGF